MYIKKQDAELFYIVGDFNEEAHTVLPEGTVERSTPTRVSSQNNTVAS